MDLIVMLERGTDDDPKTVQSKYVLRASVPAGRTRFYEKDPDYKSPYIDTDPTDLALLVAGEWTEADASGSWQKQATNQETQDHIEDKLQDLQIEYQQRITDYNPWSTYGTSFNGTVWTQKGAA